MNVDEGYCQKILEISKRINKAQRPIRILHAIKWDESLIKDLLNSNLKKIPDIGPDYYARNDLGFDPLKKILELEEILNDVDRDFGESDPIGNILKRNTNQYIDVVRMLLGRGTPEFYKFSKKIFGSTLDYFEGTELRVYELGKLLDDILSGLKNSDLGEKYKKNISSEKVVAELNKRLIPFFGGAEINVKLDDGILSDAAAGSDYIKIKNNTMFSEKDIDIFEVHEGQVHLATTINGSRQSYAKWLAKGPPCTTVIQEGIAVMMEVLTFSTLPERAKRINDRLLACEMVERGSNIKDVLNFYQEMGQSKEDALENSLRIFRGGVLSGGSPFTKDISYCTGFIQVYNFVRMNIRLGMPELLPFLFCGKVTLDDVPVLYEYHKKGLINFPQYLPKKFSDLNGLSVWMAFSSFLNKMKLETLSDKYKSKLAG